MRDGWHRTVAAITAAAITDATAAGRAMLTAADAAAQRALLGLTAAGFRADRNSVDQTGIADSTATTVQFGNEVFDIGGYYNNATWTWTPPAGQVVLSAKLSLQGSIAAAALGIVYLYKNGNILAYGLLAEGIANNDLHPQVAILDNANGTDAYLVKAYLDTSAGTGTINGNPIGCFFCGAVVH